MRPILLVTCVSAILTLITLSSCGVVVHGSGAGADGGGTSSAVLGERAVPGYTVSAVRLSDLRPGEPCALRVTVVPEAGQATVASLEVWLGTTAYDPRATTISASAVAGVAGAYDVTMALPANLATDAVAWIRLTTSDGAVIEAGRDAFPMAGRNGR